MNLCQKYFQEDKYEEAIQACTKQIPEEYPVESLGNRGISYMRTGQNDLAISDFTRVIELESKNAPAYLNRGIAYSVKWQLDQAIRDFSKTIELDPKNVGAYLMRGRIYLLNKQYDQVVSDLTKTIELDPKNIEAFLARGFVHAFKAQFDQAIGDATKLIELNSQDADGYSARGFISMLKGDFTKATADYSIAAELSTKNESFLQDLLIATWLTKGTATDVMNKLRNLVDTVHSDELITTISRFYLGNHKLTEQAVLTKARNGKDSKDINERLCEAYYYLGAKRLASGNRKGAMEFFSKAIESGEEFSPSALLSKALLTQIKQKKIPRERTKAS